MNKTASIKATIALVQLTCHPSLRIGESFLSWEPFHDEEGTGPLQTLWDNGLQVDSLQRFCRDRYLLWHRARLAAIVDWFDSLDQEELPDVIVFPEGSIPRKFLSCLHRKLSRGNRRPTIFAGTHSYEWSAEAWRDYEELGVSRSQLLELSQSKIESLSVCPILHQDERVTLQPKQLLSPWEITAIGLASDSVQCKTVVVEHELENGAKFSINAFVCSEALQQIGTTDPSPDLLVVLSHNRDFLRFAGLEEHYSKNQIPVAYCNDGKFGGSHIHIVNDARNENWFARSPRSGVLPPGDGILLLQTNLKNVAPSTGINNPLPTSRLLRLSSVVPENVKDSSYRVSRALSELSNEVTTAIQSGGQLEPTTIAAKCAQLEELEKPSLIQRIQVKRLGGLARNNATPIVEWGVFANDSIVSKSHFREALRVLIKFGVLQADRKHEFAQGDPVLPCGLPILERQLTEYCLQGLSTLLDSVNGSASKVVVAVRSRLLKHLGVSSSLSPNGALSNLMREMRQESHEAASVSLSNAVARLVERYGATSGMLFIANQRVGANQSKETSLSSAVMVNTPVQYIERKTGSDNGIVGHVAKTLSPYIADRVVSDALETDAFLDKYYRSTVPNTVSELAVPIIATTLDGGQKELVGVLNLESKRPGAFSTLQIQALLAEVTQLVVDIRVMLALADPKCSTVWHPQVHGWGLNMTLNRVCHRIATTHSFGRTPPSVSCTIWHADSVKGVLYVLGTSRYDFEFVADEMLQYKDSFLGTVMNELKNGGVVTGKVEDLRRFRRRIKAERMELDRVTVSKFDGQGDDRHGLPGLLAIYSFSHEATDTGTNPDVQFTADTVSRLAISVGQLIKEVLQQQALCALAHQAAAVAIGSVTKEGQLNRARVAIGECLEASQSTVFEVKNDEARVVSTSGVNLPDSTYEVGPPSKRPDGRIVGFTRFLTSKTKLTLRKHDVPDPDEVCSLCEGVGHIVPENRICELGAATASEHRRFLGASLACNEKVIGAIRLIRDEQERPFTIADENLLSILSHSIETLICHRPALRVGSSATVESSPQRNATQSWSWRSMDIWLQTYRQLCDDQFPNCEPVLASIRCAAADGRGDTVLRLLSYHSIFSKSCRKSEVETSQRRPNIGWLTIDPQQVGQISNYKPRIITFERLKTKLYSCGVDHNLEVMSGICIPISWIGFGKLTAGVVAVDFTKSIEANAESIRSLFRKSVELSDMTQRNRFEFTDRSASMADSFAAIIASHPGVFKQFAVYWRSREEDSFTTSNCVNGLPGHQEIDDETLTRIQNSNRKFDRWDPHLSFFADGEAMGIRIEKDLVWMPLRIGPFVHFGFCGRLVDSWLADRQAHATMDVGERLKREALNRDEVDSTIRKSIESTFGGTLEELFTAKAILAMAEELHDDWIEIVVRGEWLWREWNITFEQVNNQLSKTIDTEGLCAWGAVLTPVSKSQEVIGHFNDVDTRLS